MLSTCRYTDDGLIIGRGRQCMQNYTDAAMNAAETESVRCANLPKAPIGFLTFSTKQQRAHVDRYHNACLVTVTNRPWYLLVACRDIQKGEMVQAHYGPSSGFLLGQYAAEKFVY